MSFQAKLTLNCFSINLHSLLIKLCHTSNAKQLTLKIKKNMATFLSFSLLCFFFFIFFLSLCSFNGGTGGSDIINETCRKSAKSDPNINYNFCVSSLQTGHKSHNPTNLKQLGITAVKLTKSNASHTKSFIKNLLKNKKLDPFVKLALQDCMEVYSDAVDLLKEAIKDVKEKRYSEANIKLSSAMDSSSSCEEGFNEKKGKDSPLTKENKDVFQLAAISLSIINMFGGNGYY
ncbi:hypothetical protein NE237_024884 [Protea cynaroides]|uniref:Putative invertase inhibitor n=1 Tax=Protea cynaroides TaxID=273540 RepID=A0A9Q0H3U8_9MAGN|nr:hypothetical protein NE237_024884 [Protea cynaroides]